MKPPELILNLDDFVGNNVLVSEEYGIIPTIKWLITTNDGPVLFKGKKSVKEIKDWLEDFQKTLNRAAGNQHLQFTA